MKKNYNTNAKIHHASIIPHPSSMPITRIPKRVFQASKEECSVVIVSYKTGDILLDCIKSVLKQRLLHQLILVDNGNSRQAVKALNKLADDEPRLDIITGQGNVGFAQGCNIGVRRARGDYLLLLNPDSILEDGTLESAVGVFQKHPEASVITIKIVNPDGTEQRGARRNLMTPWTCLVEQFRLDRIAPNHPHFKRLNLNETSPLKETTPVQCISGAFMLMHKRLYNELGGMDEDYFLHVEDVDFCMRIEKNGGKILYVPSISTVHQRSTSKVYPGFVEWHKTRSFCMYFQKHFCEQYPAWALSVFSVAIHFRFLLRLPPITLVWLMRLIFQREKR